MFGQDAIPNVLKDEFEKRGREATIDASRIEKIKEICQKEDYLFYAPLLKSLMTEIFYDVLQMSQIFSKIETDEF